MNNDTIIQAFTQRINGLLSAEPEHFLVEIKIKPVNNIKIFIDGDKGIAIEKLVQYNRRLYKQLEEEAFFPDGDFSLEVSSPGLDEPLKLFRQYQKNLGREVEITDSQGVKMEGRMAAVSPDSITIETENGKGKKKIMSSHSIPFNSIKTTKIQIKF